MTESNSAGNETDFSFTVSGGVVAVVYIQAKPDINAFTYAGGTVGDSGLHAPLSDGNLESVEFTVWCVASVTGGADRGNATLGDSAGFGTHPHRRLAHRLGARSRRLSRLRLRARPAGRPQHPPDREQVLGANSYSFRYRVPAGKAMPARIALQVLNLDGTRQWRSARVAH